MPAIDTRGPNKDKPKRKVYGPPAPKAKVKKVAGPPAPPPKPVSGPAKPARKPRKPTPAETATSKRNARALAKGAVGPERAPRKPTPAERTNIRISSVGARRAGEQMKKKSRENRESAKIKLRINTLRRDSKLTQSQASVGAPVLKVLEQTTRPLHAIAAATDEALHGGRVGTIGTGASPTSVLKAAGRGLKNEDKTTFSDVIKHAGVKNKKVAGIGGFALDVAADPTTYVTGGAGPVAARTAAKAAKSAEKKALKAGLSKDQAAKMGDRAHKQAERKGDQTKGATVKVGGREVPGVRKATAKASKPVRAAGRKLIPQKVRDAARSVAADVNPDITPAGVSRETSRKATQATRTARSKSNRGLHEAQQQALGIKQQVGEANYSRIIDAIENGTIGKLPPDLRDVAVRVRSQFRHANRQRKQAGIRGGEIKQRGRVPVPEIVADTTTSSKAVAKARRAEDRAKADLDRAHSARDIHQGRAEVLSRNVSGSSAEKAAERGRVKRKVRDSGEVFYHASRAGLRSGGHETASFEVHLGTRKAAEDRAKAFKGATEHKTETYRLPRNATVPKGSAKGSKDNPFTEAELGTLPPHMLKAAGVSPWRYQQALRELREEGFDAVYYRNEIEDKGSLSALALDRRKLKPARLQAEARYAGGGHGVQQTATAAKDAAQRLKNAKAARETAETAHGKSVADAAVQRAARDLAEKTNAKRAAAPKEYIPHQLTDEAAEESGKAARGGPGRKVIQPGSSKARKDNRPLSELRKEHPGKYSEDLPNLYAGRKAEGATSVARAELNRRIADLGRTVKKGRDITLEKGESVYHVLGSDIRKIPSKEAAQVAEKGGKNGRYVVLNDDVVKRAIEGAQPTLQGPGIVKGLDKVQAGFKRIALATPGFHVRNLVGDTQNAYLGQAGHRIPKNMVDAGRILKAEGRRDKSLRKLEPGKTGGKTLNTPKYGKVTYDEAAEHLGKHGGMRTGYTGRELPELAASGSKGKVRVGGVRVPRRAKQALLNREDLPRLTTAVDALKHGATWEEAAQKVADYHFDYGHLTQFERQFARRAAPFYTFSARNIPLQTKSLITKPGKYANYEKLREEAAKASGMDEESQKARALTDQLRAAGVKLPKGWESNLTEWEARNAGVPISWKGQKFTVSMGMPLVDLNEFPGAALGDQINEYYQKGMSLTSPIPKDIIEYMENHSFFFRDELERQNAPLVAAPEWVKGLPAGLKKRMGVTENFVDKKTGKRTLGYRAKADYVLKSIPGTPAFLNKLATQGHDRVGKGPLGKTLAFAGVKATPYDPVATAVNAAYARRAEVETRMAALRQQGVSMKNPTAAYLKLNDQLKILTRIAYEGREKQGYKVLPTQGGPKKARSSSSGRVKVPGVSGRVKVPGAGGRVKVP